MVDVHRLVRWVFVLFLIQDGRCEDPSFMTKMKQIKDKVFKDYDRLIRPLNETSNATNVLFGLVPQYIVDIDEDRSLFELDSWFFMHWFDPRLTWDENHQVDMIQVPINMIWMPDISLYNSHTGSVSPYQEVMALVMRSGLVFWIPPTTSRTYCAAAGKDEVTCDLLLGSWTTHGWQLDLDVFEHDPLDMSEFTNENPSWEMKVDEASLKQQVDHYSCCEEPYHSLRASFPLVRRPPTRLSVLRPLCGALAALSCALLLAPPTEHAARALLGAALFLAANLMLAGAAALAGSSQGAKSGVPLIRAMTVVVTAVLIVQVVTMRLARCTGPSRPHPGLMLWISGALARYACLASSAEKPTQPKDEWGLVAAAVDRVVLIVCLPAMVTLMCVF